MFPEYFITWNSLGMFISSFLIAEAFYRSKIKAILTLQRNLEKTKSNLVKISNKIGRKGASGIILNFGNKTFNFHHSRFGWLLAISSIIISNLTLFWFSFGLILHHLIREKKLF